MRMVVCDVALICAEAGQGACCHPLVGGGRLADIICLTCSARPGLLLLVDDELMALFIHNY